MPQSSPSPLPLEDACPATCLHTCLPAIACLAHVYAHMLQTWPSFTACLFCRQDFLCLVALLNEAWEVVTVRGRRRTQQQPHSKHQINSSAPVQAALKMLVCDSLHVPALHTPILCYSLLTTPTALHYILGREEEGGGRRRQCHAAPASYAPTYFPACLLSCLLCVN